MLYLSSTPSPTFYKFRIQEDISILHFQVHTYSRCIFIHKVHNKQMENSFKSSLSSQLVKMLKAS
jgi:hypothetical protein